MSEELYAWLVGKSIQDGTLSCDLDETAWGLLVELEQARPDIHRIYTTRLAAEPWMAPLPLTRLELDIWTNHANMAALIEILGERLAGLRPCPLDPADILDDGSTLSLLAAASGLKRLDLSGMGCTDAGLRHLASLSTLEELVLGRLDVTAAGLAMLPRSLKQLTMGYGHGAVTAEMMSFLAHQRALVVLQVASSPWADDALEVLAALPALRCLTIAASLETRLSVLSRMPHLESLRLSDNKSGSARALAQLHPLTRLVRLDLGAARVNEKAMLSVLSRNPGLRDLRLLGGGLTDKSAAAIGALTGLEVLAIRADFTDAAVPHLSRLTALRSLSLHSTRMSTTGFAALRALPELYELSVSFNKLGDALGVELAHWGHLAVLSCARCGISAPTLQALRSALTGRTVFTSSVLAPDTQLYGPPHHDWKVRSTYARHHTS